MFLLDFSAVVFTILLIAGVPLAAFALRQACSLCRSEIPSYRRAFLTVLITTPIIFLAVDFSAYITLRALNGYGVRVPEGYGYADWFDEPWGLKLAALAHAPFFRYAPVIFGLCVAGFLQVFALEIHFRSAVPIFVIQWGATLLGLTVIVFILGLAGLPEPSFEMPEPPEEPEVRPGMPESKDKPEPPDEMEVIKKKISMIAPQIDKNGEPILPGQQTKPGSSGKPTADANGAAAQPVQSNAKAKTRNYRLPGKKWAYLLEILREDADPYLTSLKSAGESFTESLPTPFQDFLNKGGWWALITLLAAGSGLWIWSFMTRVQEELLASAGKPKVMRRYP